MNKTPFALVALLAVAAQADVSVSKIFGSNMVLQRDKPVPVWGKAAPGEDVRVSFAGQNLATKADDAGNWQVELKPLKVSKDGAELVVGGSANTNVFKNVLVGDVWLCSGQSNMEMTFGWGIYQGDMFKAESVKFPTIRRMKIRKCTKPAPEPYDVPVDLNWAVASNAFPNITATGYFFARKLTQELDIPIGLIDDSWSGCAIEPFISPEGFHMVPALSASAERLDAINPATEKGRASLEKAIADTRKWLELAEISLAEKKMPSSQPPQLPTAGNLCGQYNWMISPITRFPIKGAIWYQGCTNGGDGDIYADKTEGLVLGWRKAWGYDFPFYWVQLASYTPFTDDPAGGNGYARIRDAQRKAMRIPKTGMAVAIDVGNPGDIHPKAKLFVGERLALWALAKDYGKDIVCSGPLVKGAVVEPAGLDADVAKVRVSFDYTGSGLMAGKKEWKDNSPVEEDVEAAGKLKGFALKGADEKWYWATAVIDGKDVVLSAPEVKEPVAVRYAFRANPLGKCSLYNKEGLPASPFSINIPRPAQEAAQ
jgi:sialate O-acetylesterase